MLRVAVITGAARRLGAATAHLLHREGFNVVVHCRASLAQAESLVATLNAGRAHSAVVLQADLSSPTALQSFAGQAAGCWGRVDVLINNASTFYPGAIESVTDEDWEALTASNLRAPFFLVQALLPSLRAAGGCVVNMADIHGERGLPGYPVYSIAKAGLVAMTKILARELAPLVRVNAVAPGAILWPEGDMSDTEKQAVLQKVALQRCGREDDIAKAIRYLVLDADYVTGQILTVDGGRLLFS